jgi:hypothetical protein
MGFSFFVTMTYAADGWGVGPIKAWGEKIFWGMPVFGSDAVEYSWMLELVLKCLISVVGTYLGPKILLRYHEGLYDSHVLFFSVVGTYLGPEILFRYHEGLC